MTVFAVERPQWSFHVEGVLGDAKNEAEPATAGDHDKRGDRRRGGEYANRIMSERGCMVTVRSTTRPRAGSRRREGRGERGSRPSDAALVMAGKRTPNRPAWEYMTNFGASSAPSRDLESSLVSYPSLPHHLDGLPHLFSLPCM